jgi:hypothetical protein
MSTSRLQLLQSVLRQATLISAYGGDGVRFATDSLGAVKHRTRAGYVINPHAQRLANGKIELSPPHAHESQPATSQAK